MIDKEIQEELYDPASKRKGSAYLNFVKAHKSWRLPSGLLDLKRIAKAWRLQKKAKSYDPSSKKSKIKYTVYYERRVHPNDQWQQKQYKKEFYNLESANDFVNDMRDSGYYVRIGKPFKKSIKPKSYDPTSRKHRQRRSLKSAAKARLHSIKKAVSWKDFVKARMGLYMKKYGSHSAAIKKIAKEWKEAKYRRYDPGKTHEYQITMKGRIYGNVRATSDKEARDKAVARYGHGVEVRRYG